MNKMIDVKSTVKAMVSINVPSLNLRRSWAKKGAIQKIDADLLQQAYFEPGVEYLFKTGILYIDDMNVKIALGLEAPGAEEPTNVIELTDEYAKKLLTGTAFKDLKEILEKLSHDQLIELANTAIELEVTDYQRCKLLMDKTGIDVMKASIARKEDRANEEK